MNVTTILEQFYPEAGWAVRGNPQSEEEYIDSVIWNNDQKQPTWSELNLKWIEAEYLSEYKKVSDQRKSAYISESDPIFFQWQRKEKTEKEWLDSIQAINERFPYPENHLV